MKTNCALILLTILALSCSKNQTEDFPIVLPKAEKPFPVVAWHGVHADYSSPERFQEAEEMGITLNYTRAGSLDKAIKLLNDAATTNIKMIIECSELYGSSTRENAVKTLMKYPALGGYFCRDEPTGSAFREIARMEKEINSIDGNHFCYVNLFPTGPANHIKALGYHSYDEYVIDYLSTVPASFLSFDFYPIVNTANGVVVRPEWYENLSTCANLAERFRVPLWAFMLTVRHSSYIDPTIEHLRMQTYSNLAYGAQVLQCFTYWTPGDVPSEVENYFDAPITHDGHKTRTYSVVKEMLSELNRLAWVFEGASREGTWHLSSSGKIPNGAKRLSTLPDNVEAITFSGEGEGLISVIKNHGYTFMMFQNTDINNSCSCKISLHSGVRQISKDGIISKASDNESIQTIPPGDILLYMWK